MADTPDIVERLTEAREEMHRRGLDSAFHNARMQAQRWGSAVGLALIELASQRDEIERLRRTAPAGVVGWQPIETAPENVEIIIAVFRDDFEDPIIQNSILFDGEERGKYWSNWHGMPEPTHWEPVNDPRSK